jgi:hypothetical protein
MPIAGAAFLPALARTFAWIHVDDDDPRRPPLMHLADPLLNADPPHPFSPAGDTSQKSNRFLEISA